MSEHSDKHSFCKCPEFSSLRRCGASAAKAKTSRRNNDTCVQSYDFDKDALREKLFQRAALCYRQIGNEAYIENQLRGIIKQNECLESFNAELTNKIVKQIRLSDDGSVRIILINDQEIRKEQTDHASSSPSDAT